MAEANSTKIVRLETQMAEANRKIEKVGDQVTALDAKFDVKFNQLLDGLDKRYASKLAERIVYSLIALIVIAVIVALLALVVFPNQLGSNPPSSSSSSATTGGTGQPGSAGSTTTNNTTNTTSTPANNTKQPSGGANVTVPLTIP